MDSLLLNYIREIEIYYNHFYEQIIVYCDSVYIKEGNFLIGSFGKGNTIIEAIADYLSQLRGKTVVIYRKDGSRIDLVL